MIPKVLHEHIDTAFPANVMLVGVVQPNGYAQISPRGSTMVYDDQHLALWERGKGSTNRLLQDGTKVTVFLRKPALREAGILPKGGVARFYGTAKLHKSGEAYERVWEKLVQPEKDRDPQRKGFAVLIKIERGEDLDGEPLKL
jgi:hypothetical protein